MSSIFARIKARYSAAYENEIAKIDGADPAEKRRNAKRLNTAALLLAGGLWGAALGVYILKGSVSVGLVGAAAAILGLSLYAHFSGRFPILGKAKR